MDALAELTKSLLIPGTLTFLLFTLTIGVALEWGGRRLRVIGRLWLTTLAFSYWVASMPRVADALATRFHAVDAAPLTVRQLEGLDAIVVLGAGIRTTYEVGGHYVAIPDAQTIYNAMEAARLYHLVPGGLPVLASGGHQDGAAVEATESGILKDWLLRANVPAERILLESGSRTTREQAALVAPILKARGWTHFALVTPAVQGPRAARVFALQGVEPVLAPAPFWTQGENARAGWTPTGGALRASERATYDYLAWGYYWLRGWQ